MSRLRPLHPEDMSPEQAQAYRAIESKGGRLGGPYNAYIRIPQFMGLNQDMGDCLRRNSLAPRVRSLVVLRTVKHWGARFAWAMNRPAAEKAGVESSIVDAIDQGREPAGLEAKEVTALQVAAELLQTKAVTDATYARAVQLFGENGVADIVVTAGFYSMVSMTLNAFDIDPPGGTRP